METPSNSKALRVKLFKVLTDEEYTTYSSSTDENYKISVFAVSQKRNITAFSKAFPDKIKTMKKYKVNITKSIRNTMGKGFKFNKLDKASNYFETNDYQLNSNNYYNTFMYQFREDKSIYVNEPDNDTNHIISVIKLLPKNFTMKELSKPQYYFNLYTVKDIIFDDISEEEAIELLKTRYTLGKTATKCLKNASCLKKFLKENNVDVKTDEYKTLFTEIEENNYLIMID